MRVFGIVFTILSTVSLLTALAIFIAGSSIFIFEQLYHSVYERGGFFAALLVMLPAIFLFSYAFLQVIKKMFLTIWNPEEEARKFELTEKVFLSILLYEISKFLIKRKRKKVS